MSFGEFIEWIEYLKIKDRRNSKQDVYLAQIAAEVRRGYVKIPKNVKLTDFLLGSEGRDKVKQSKQTWAAHLGIDLGKN